MKGGARTATVVTAALLALLTAVVVGTLRVGDSQSAPGRILVGYAVAWGLFAAAARVVRTVPVRAATPWSWSVPPPSHWPGSPPHRAPAPTCTATPGTGASRPPGPPLRPPARGPQLAPLRDAWLFPTARPCAGWGLTRTDEGLCTRINRPTVPTVYPPLAEGWFLAVHALSPPDSRHKPLQIGGAVVAFATTLALLAVVRRRGDPCRAPPRAALWAWCPAVPFEAVNNAHIDALGVLFTVLALGTATAGARRGVLLGAATAVKLLPVLTLPGALSGQRAPARVVRVVVPLLVTVALCYLPYVLLSGKAVLGYLPGYLHEEGYAPGDVRRFVLPRLLLPDTAAAVTAGVLLAVLALSVWWRGDPARPWRGALLVTGTALLLFSPNYPWYALLVVGLVALDGRVEWLAVPLAGAVLYLGGPRLPGFPLQALTYVLAALAVATGAVLRSDAVRHRLPRHPPTRRRDPERPAH
ncbi:glycosyltransferase 87 family protein [Streptomyces noursei]|uniref:DUF2029 domain-containing protein n=1 Tax=Streptomyces noursei TaxID=1971 RepID=A0A401QQ84_STRNR|nr:glycosyltransferase 87 family protein [Streptomyces noursei]GCB87579.1 hypothetical protein SALB_00230 [Streptomyces noursei]